MPENMKMRMSQLIKSLPKNNLEGSESYLKATKNTGIDNRNILKSEENEIVEYKCSKCRDLRFILKDNEAIPCTCKGVREAEEILLNSGISEEFRKKNFDNFNYAYNMEVCEAFSKAKEYVKNFDKSCKNKSIIFVGQVGSGKTHLSMAIANSLMEKGVGVLYMPYRDNIISLKQNMMDEEYYRKVMNKFKRAKVLLIDDLFKGSISGSDVNIMFEIINYRYLNYLPIIVSSEFSIDKLLGFDQGVGSRIYEMCKDYIVEVEQDIRNNYRWKLDIKDGQSIKMYYHKLID